MGFPARRGLFILTKKKMKMESKRISLPRLMDDAGHCPPDSQFLVFRHLNRFKIWSLRMNESKEGLRLCQKSVASDAAGSFENP